jgi:signal transduction histidine kinase
MRTIRWNRARLTLALTSPMLLLALVMVISALAFLSTGGPGAATTQTGLARVGEILTLVIVTDEGAAAARDFVFDWFLVAPALSLIPAVALAWLAAGRVLGQIDRANSEVEAADEERRSRLQEVVHELRTPLAVMGTNLELASAEPGLDAAGYIEAARRAVDRMAGTVDDLEGYGRLLVEEARGPVDLASLAEAAVAEHTGPGRARGVYVTVGDSVPAIVPAADPAAVRTAIGNFLSNAVRLAPRGSTVRVEWGEMGDWAWISVHDEGPGLAPHLHARAFERGWQGSHDRDRGRSGEAGLGLTIARQLTEAQGGVVTVDSEEGGGAVFTVWLPLARGASLGAVVAPDGIHSIVQPWRKRLQAV